MSDDSNEWDESTAEDRIDRENTEDLVEALKRRGYHAWATSTPNEPIYHSPGCNPLDSAQQGKAFTLDEFIAEVERVTKVAILRDLAAELADSERIIAMYDGQLAQAVARELLLGRKVRTLCALIGERMRERADQLEKGTPP
jgi:hypothetical protein